MDNGELYKKYCGGDDNALVEIIKNCKDGLMLYINGITGNIFLAEEIMEDTFFKIAVKKPKFKGKSSFKTWLYTIGRNTAIDRLRKESKISIISAEEYNSAESEEDIEKDFIKEEQKIILHRSMKKLNTDYRQVLYLFYFEELDTENIAAIMKKSRKQVGNLLYRAKQSLKTILEKEGFDYENL